MALSGLAGSGGFMSAEDVKRYDAALQEAISKGQTLGISDYQPQDSYQKIGFTVGGGNPQPQPRPTPVVNNAGKKVTQTQAPIPQRINSQNISTQRVGGGMPAPQNSTNVPANYTGMWGQDPYQMGTVQTRGGGWTPEGYYSTGYHGSGEHPEIQGEATPGVYKSGSFGSIYTPDFSNDVKINDYINYLKELGYDTSDLTVSKLRQQDRDKTFNADLMLQILPNKSEKNKELLKGINPSTPYETIRSSLGGREFSTLFNNAQMGQQQSALTQAQEGVQNLPEEARVGGAKPKSITSGVEEISPVSTQNYTSVNPSALQGSIAGYNNILKEQSLFS